MKCIKDEYLQKFKEKYIIEDRQEPKKEGGQITIYLSRKDKSPMMKIGDKEVCAHSRWGVWEFDSLKEAEDFSLQLLYSLWSLYGITIMSWFDEISNKQLNK